MNLQLAPLPAAATATPVTIVCAADGTIYCLDAMGSGGTTKVYWTYPSQIPASVPTWSAGTTYDIANFVTGSDGKIYRSVQTANTGNNPVTDVTHVWWEFGDPNQDTGLDGPGGVAQMPTGFDISSALIQTVGGQDRLYIGASNGRVYCIDMAGRGDMNTTTGVPGTTTRVWSYPSDYPSAVVSSNLGAFKGSLAFKTITAGDTIFAGASQGRMYALDAVGNSVTKTTTARWQYPTSTAQTLGAITTTPAVDFGNVYFGTSMSNNGSTPGAFCAVNQDTGALVWSVSSTTDPLSGGATVNMDNFLGGPATASATQVGNPAGNPDVVFASNENRYIFAFDAATGNVLWQTNELNSGVSGTLTFSPMTVISNAGAPTPYPILLVPTSDGRFDGLFCRTPLGGVDPIDGRLNIKGTHRAYEFRAADSVSASIATGLGWMIAGDLGGNLFGFNDGTGLTGGPPPPGGVTTVENAPPGSGPDFSTAKIRFIKQSAYQQLRANPVGETYANIDAGVDDMTSTGYEWGQTLYAIVYNFPYADNGVSGTVLPPIVNFSLSIEGATLRQLSSESKLFPDRTDYPTDNFGGFAMLAFTIQGSGANALPPGHGAISISISSGAGTSDGSSETFTVVPTGTTIFSIANPLALVMHPNGSPPPAAQQIGYTTNPTDPENLVNGSPNVTGLESLLTSSAGIVSHGQSANAGIAVVDRSLMTILRGPGHGLDQVRVNRDDLVWNKGFLAGSVAKPLPAFAVNFEDLPVNYPNNSLDYPDIKRGTIKVTKDLSGNPENALFNGVSLFPPTYGVGQDLNSNPARNLTETPFTFEIDVPKYQPYNNQQDNDSSSTLVDAGYKGQMTVFVDSTGSGVFDITGKRQAFRTFSLAASVSEDERLSIGTPVVDLGALPIGTGFSPTAPWLSGSTFSPFTGPYAALFQPFVVNNDGNVNLVDLRLAHGTRRDTNPAVAWQIFAPANDFLGWLDGSYNLWSDIDDAFYFDKIGQHQVILQKARVGDRSPTQLSVDPYPRANANLNVVGGTANALVPGGPVGPPHVAVSVPLGFPSGTYSSVVRVIEDTSKTGPSAQNLDLNASNVPTESYGDPSFTLKFTAREAQLTNTYSKLTAPMADDLVPAGAPPLFTYQNVQPTATRDPVGNLIVAWASDRRDETSPTKAGIWAPPLPSQATTDPRLRIFVASVQGTNPSADTYGTSPLNDLNAFVPDPSTGSPATRWFQQEVGPFPSGAVDSLFGAAPGEVIPETAQFHYPSLPALGFADPLSPGTTFSSGVTMAFIGDAQLQKANGRIRESRLFATTVTSDSTGTIVTTAPVSMEGDINAAKGRPSVVQFAGNNAVIFYTSAGAGESVLNWVTFNGTTFGDPQQVKLPDGFESVEAPSAVARTYSGVNSLLASKPIIDLAFTGKLRGRANPEVFFGRIAADGSPAGTPVESAYLPSQTAEILTRESDPGLYRALGVAWNIPQMNWTSTTAYVRDDTVAFDGQYFVCIAATSTGEQPDAFPASWQSIFNLYYVINGTAHDLLYGDLWSGSITYQIGARVIGSDGKTYSSIVAANLGNDPVSSPGSWSLTQAQSKPAVDPSSGLITAETPLGRVYIDPSLGTVRFATAAPNPNATIALTYQPLFTRMSSGTASGYSLPSLMFDNRYVSDISYWRVPGDTAASVSDATLRNGRYLAIFSRAAAGAGQAARPFMTALRLGVKLPAAVATASDGTVASLTVTGNSGDYQIDPAQGKIYFTTVDEDQTVTVNFTGVDASGNSLSGLTITGKVGLIVERAEAPMPIDQAINESNVTSFIDPFDGVGGTPGPMQRPNLFWVFWSSTRGGGSDLFFQTLAPRFAPQVGGN